MSQRNIMYASPPAHTLTFRSKLNQISVPRTIIDHALSLTTPDEGSSKFQRTQTPYRHTPLINSNMKHLVLASFNTRSIYGRETWITELIKKHHFAVMGIQDPKLRMKYAYGFVPHCSLQRGSHAWTSGLNYCNPPCMGTLDNNTVRQVDSQKKKAA